MNTTIIDGIFFYYFLGQKQLLQFTIGNPEFRLSNNGSLLKAVFTLHRIPSYILINTYIPSFFIMLMTIVPLYLKDDTQYATTLVLLNILCLYTVLQSSRDGIPKTAYLKVSKSQKHFFLKLHCPKKVLNIWQKFCSTLRSLLNEQAELSRQGGIFLKNS